MDDLISRQAAIDELPYLLDYDGLKGENGFVSKRLVRKMLKELPPAHPEPQWIPCENDLPDIGMTVLFCDIDGDEFIGHRALHWWWSVDEKVKNVIAWMPLPEPYTK